MEILKNYGKLGLIIATIAFILLFIQNSFNSDIIRDSINYNLIYSFSINEYNEKEQYLSLQLKNNGIKYIDNIRIDVNSRSNKISDIIILDTANYIILRNETSEVLKKKSLILNDELYPGEKLIILIELKVTEKINLSDFNLLVNSKLTNGIQVKTITDRNIINLQNLKLHIKSTGFTIVYITFYIIIPITFFLLIIVIIYKGLKRNESFKKFIEFIKQ